RSAAARGAQLLGRERGEEASEPVGILERPVDRGPTQEARCVGVREVRDEVGTFGADRGGGGAEIERASGAAVRHGRGPIGTEAVCGTGSAASSRKRRRAGSGSGSGRSALRSGSMPEPAPSDLDLLLPRLVALRRDLHRHPELGFEEWRTQAVVQDFLSEHGYAPRTVAGTGV